MHEYVALHNTELQINLLFNEAESKFKSTSTTSTATSFNGVSCILLCLENENDDQYMALQNRQINICNYIHNQLFSHFQKKYFPQILLNICSSFQIILEGHCIVSFFASGAILKLTQ